MRLLRKSGNKKNNNLIKIYIFSVFFLNYIIKIFYNFKYFNSLNCIYNSYMNYKTAITIDIESIYQLER